MILIANYCTAQGGCKPDWTPEWHETCLSQTVEDICGRTDCTQPLDKAQHRICLDHVNVGSCPELRQNRDTILTCVDVPAPACSESERRRSERQPELICEGVAEVLFDCDRSTMPSGCAFRQTEAAECLAVERSEEEWNAIADCMDDSHSCKKQLACLQDYGLQ